MMMKIYLSYDIIGTQVTDVFFSLSTYLNEWTQQIWSTAKKQRAATSGEYSWRNASE